MSDSARFPAPKVLLRALVVIVAIAVPIGAVHWLLGENAATSAMLGVVAMLIAMMHLRLQLQLVIGLLAGVAAGLGAMVDGKTLLLTLVIIVLCLAQWRFNQWTAASGALLPPVAFYYWAQAAEHDPLGTPVQVVLATWLGAAIAMGIAALAKLQYPAHPAGRNDSVWHAVGLAIGCSTIIVVVTTFELPRGFWGILTICLVYRPNYLDTRIKAWQRTLGTVIGSVVAVAIGIAAPRAVILGVAAVGAIFALAYLFVNNYLIYTAFLTVTIVLGFSAGEPVLDLAEERAGMTILGAVLALVLTALTALLRSIVRARLHSDAQDSPSGSNS